MTIKNSQFEIHRSQIKSQHNVESYIALFLDLRRYIVTQYSGQGRVQKNPYDPWFLRLFSEAIVMCLSYSW